MKALAFAILLTACGAAMPECPLAYEDPGDGAAMALVTTDADLLPQAQCAAARWTKATGIAIRAGERSDGRNIAVKWWTGPRDGSDVIGEYVPNDQAILIKNTLPGKFAFPALVAHEVGHALEDSDGHIDAATPGLMTPNELEDPQITRADLALVCEQAACTRERAE